MRRCEPYFNFRSLQDLLNGWRCGAALVKLRSRHRSRAPISLVSASENGSLALPKEGRITEKELK